VKRLLTIVLVLCACGALPACAATNSWNGGDGSWDSQNNWSLHQRPSSGQDIVITNAGTFTVTLDDKVHANTLTVLSLTLSNTSGASMLLVTNRPSNNSPLTLTVLSDVVVDSGATVRLVDSSSTTSGVSVVASNVFNDYALTLQTNASLIVSNVLHTATKSSQIGSLTTAGGNVAARSVRLGEATGSLGTWTILDGINLVGETLQIGSDGGTGIVNRVGGKLIVGGNASDYGVSIAGSANSTGTVILVQGQLQPSSSLAIGERGFGNLIVSNGGLPYQPIDIGVRSGSNGHLSLAGGSNTVIDLNIGVNSGATGEVWITGGRLDMADIYVGGTGGGGCGVGSLVISNGELAVGNYFGISECFNSVGTVTIAGGSTVASFVSLGGNSKGVLWLTGGELVVTGTFPNGRFDFRYGPESRLVCSGGVLTAREVDLGFHSPQQTWEIAGGTNVVQDVAYVVHGLCKISGGKLEVPQLQVGWAPQIGDGGGQLVVSGGEAQVTAGLVVGGFAATTGIVNVAGGLLTVTSSFAVATVGAIGAGEVHVSSGTFAANTIWLGGSSGSVGTMTVSGGLVESGPFSGSLMIGENPGSTGVVLYTGGTLHAGPITVGDAGYGYMSISSNAAFPNFDVGLRVGNQSGAVGLCSFQGGTLSGPSARQLNQLQIGVAAGSTGIVYVTDGALAVGIGGPSVFVGQQGSGLLSITNSTVFLSCPTIGTLGTLECVNSQVTVGGSGCTMLNYNRMLFLNSTGTVFGSFQNLGTLTAGESTLTFNESVDNSGTIIATNGVLQFLGGINNSGNVVFGPDQFLITSVLRSNIDVVIGWQIFGGNRYRVQATADLSDGYSDISSEIVAAGSGFSVTNYIDVGAATNFPSRIYRVRQVF
jgi:hypothetical protein